MTTTALPPIPPFGRPLRNPSDPALMAFKASSVGGALSVLDVAGAIRKGTWPRITFAVLIAIISASVMPLGFLLAWAAFMTLWELWLRIWLENKILLPIAARSQERGFVALAWIHFVGATAYTLFPAVAWSTNTALGMVVATAWLCGSANHTFVYFSSHRWMLLSCVVPLATCAFVAPFTAAGFTTTAIAGVMVLVSLIISAGLFGYDRRVLLSVLAKHAAARMSAEQANAAKSQFLATMSHELRTPLNAVIGYAELIEEETAGAQEPLAEDARKIRDSARQLLGAIDVILDLSKLETGSATLQRERVDATIVLAQVRAAAAPLAALNNNTLRISEATPLGEADIDHVRLHQALMQIIANAAKFTQHGEIRVVASRTVDDGRARLVFEITDTGIGISSEQQARIFEPFVQVEEHEARRYEGTGLGLTLVQRLARLMGGDVTCQSTPGIGSTFTLHVDAGVA
jgi:signal transduction histidine kinase